MVCPNRRGPLAAAYFLIKLSAAGGEASLLPVIRSDRMANTKSAKKATRVIARRTEVSKARRTQMRTYLRQVEAALAAGDAKKAGEALTAAEPKIMRAAQKGVIHRNTASRKVARLAKRVRKLAG
jgi:small subunit ribosomal protein S20